MFGGRVVTNDCSGARRPDLSSYKLYKLDHFSAYIYTYVMPKSSAVADSLPPAAVSALRQLGENLGIARARRRESQRAWA